jgi:hypothetical protein
LTGFSKIYQFFKHLYRTFEKPPKAFTRERYRDTSDKLHPHALTSAARKFPGLIVIVSLKKLPVSPMPFDEGSLNSMNICHEPQGILLDLKQVDFRCSNTQQNAKIEYSISDVNLSYKFQRQPM